MQRGSARWMSFRKKVMNSFERPDCFAAAQAGSTDCKEEWRRGTDLGVFLPYTRCIIFYLQKREI